MKKGLLFGALLALIAVVGSPVVSHALLLEETRDAVSDTVKTVTATVDRTARDAKAAEDVETKRTQIEQKISEKRAQIHEKLTGKRVEQCEKKQASINQILDNRVSAASKHLERFKAIQEKLVAFVDAKDLAVDNANALELIMDDMRSSAQAAIDAASTTDFSCDNADATAPGQIVTEQVSAQKQALVQYRDALKDYSAAVKTALIAAKTATEGADQ